MKKNLIFITLMLVTCQVAWAAQAHGIAAKDAFRHMSKKTTVCGVVASARYLKGSGKEPTFLNFDDTYPKHPFTVVIWGEHRDEFDYAPESLEGESICVKGLIEQYRGKPQIIVERPAQIMLDES